MANENLNDLYFEAELKAAAKLSDQQFLTKAGQIIPDLPESLRPLAETYIGQMLLDLPVLPTKIIFVPVSHNINNPAQERRMRIEIGNILNEALRPHSILANGESCTETQSRESIIESEIATSRALFDLGSIDRQELESNIARGQQLLWGYELAVIDKLARNRNTRAFGVEPFHGRLLYLALIYEIEHGRFLSGPQFADQDTYFAIEGRTRAALAAACSHLQDGQELLFIQGAKHHIGVEAWCRRNDVPYEPKTARAVRKVLLGINRRPPVLSF